MFLTIQNNMQKVVDRRGDLDFIKGVLIFIVIWGHVCPNSSGMEYTFSWCALARITSLFAMPLFFMISGYFLKPLNLSSNLDCRLKSLFGG